MRNRLRKLVAAMVQLHQSRESTHAAAVLRMLQSAAPRASGGMDCADRRRRRLTEGRQDRRRSRRRRERVPQCGFRRRSRRVGCRAGAATFAALGPATLSGRVIMCHGVPASVLRACVLARRRNQRLTIGVSAAERSDSADHELIARLEQLAEIEIRPQVVWRSTFLTADEVDLPIIGDDGAARPAGNRCSCLDADEQFIFAETNIIAIFQNW